MDQFNDIKTIAPLTNVGLCANALARAMSRPSHLPGMVTFSGPSGWGKSSAATYAANKLRAYYVECRSSWTRRGLLLAILKEMNIQPAKMLFEMVDQAAEELMCSNRPLIVDEMDHIAAKGAVEIVRDIYESSRAAILLIGEERLPVKLKKWERFHGRMLDWVQAQPASLADARHLRALYCPSVDIADDLLDLITKTSRGSVRRICVNLERVRCEAESLGIEKIDRKAWGNRELFSGEPPRRRIAA